MANDYPVNIPAYADTADIQKAFLLYHYGIDTIPDDNYEIQPNSMAGYIRDTITAFEQAEDRLSVIPKLGTTTNLNDVISNGINLSTDNPTAGSSGLNYPSTSRGILTVVSDSSDILTFQTYQTVQATSDFWWRTGTLSGGVKTWSSWSKASKDGHTHSQYATSDSLNAKIDSSILASKAVATDSSGKIVSLSVTASELGQLAGISLDQTIQDQLSDKSDAGHNHNDIYYTKSEQPKIFVQSATPTGAVTGDLWFW